MLKPIPIKMLTHTIILRTYEKKENANILISKEIKNVYFERYTKRIYTNGIEELINGNVIYVDAKRTIPFDVEDWKENSVFEYNGETYKITAVDVYDPFGKIHHLEVYAQ